MIDTPAEPQARVEVLVGGACELHLEDGRVLRGELLPAPDDAAQLQLKLADADGGEREGMIERVPRAQVRLLRLATARRPAPASGRRLTMALPGLETLAVACTGTHSAPHGGLWLDVQLPDGTNEAWHVPPRAVPLLRWLGRTPAAHAAAPRNAAELWAALDRPPQRHARHLGMALVEAGQVTPQALAKALQAQAERRERGEPHLLIGQMLVQAGALAPAQLAAALSDWMGVPVVDLREFTPEPEALARVPRALAERGQALPLALRDDRRLAIELPAEGGGVQLVADVSSEPASQSPQRDTPAWQLLQWFAPALGLAAQREVVARGERLAVLLPRA